jgi:hypothetical protein
MILESFDRQTLAKMEVALEEACRLVATENQKHRSRRYIAKRIIKCASGGNRDLDSLRRSAIAAAEQMNARRVKTSVEVVVQAPNNRRLAGFRAIAPSRTRQSRSSAGV